MRTTTVLVAVALAGVTLGAATAAVVPTWFTDAVPARPQVAAPRAQPPPPEPAPVVASSDPVVDREGPVPAGEGLPRAPGPSPTIVPAVGDGTFTVASGTSAITGDGEVLRFAVETEDGSGVDPAAFAGVVESILFDRRSWIGARTFALQRVDSGPVDFRVTLATPATVDVECSPLTTNGSYSCWNGERTMLNLWRWYEGAEAYGSDIAGYRRYLVNHEVGHALGQPHADCAGPGDLAPVMMQQTITVEACIPSPWPYPDARPSSRPAPGPLA